MMLADKNHRYTATLLTMAHLLAKLFILMLADFFTPLFNDASHSSLLSGIENLPAAGHGAPSIHKKRTIP